MNDGGQLRSLGVSCFCIENYLFFTRPRQFEFLDEGPKR